MGYALQIPPESRRRIGGRSFLLPSTPKEKHADRGEQTRNRRATNGEFINPECDKQVKRNHSSRHLSEAEKESDNRPSTFGGRGIPVNIFVGAFHHQLDYSPRIGLRKDALPPDFIRRHSSGFGASFS
jgi:hypothetical protein